jgi:Primase X
MIVTNKLNNLQENIKLPDDFTLYLEPSNSAHSYNPSHLYHPSQGLDYILFHFANIDFPRTVSTKTTQGRQITVCDKQETLARYRQANYLDCRISGYTEVDDTPNFIFVDLDTLDSSVLNQVLNTCNELEWHPTVLFTGSGYHIYQPVKPTKLNDIEDFNKYGPSNLSTKFLRFVSEYLSNGKSDESHNPSLKSCMVRIPGSINSKNGEQVEIVQAWNGKRPSIISLLGIFYSWLASKEMGRQTRIKKYAKYSKFKNKNNKIKWIEDQLLKTAIADGRKMIVNLVLAPYLVNIRNLEFENASGIIGKWLSECSEVRTLSFHAARIIENSLCAAKNSQFKPMRLDILKEKHIDVYRKII